MRTLHFKLNEDEVAEFKKLIDRATNTMDPQKWPSWLVYLEQELKRFLKEPV